MKLSVAYALHNEEKNITRSLDSLYDLASEIIIVDGASTDATQEILKKYDSAAAKTSGGKTKITIYEYDNPAMFHINKQRAIEKCTGEWILQMDADELISPELKEEIESVIARNDSHVAYWIPRLNYFLDKPLKKGGQYPDYTIRLYKNGVAKFPCKTVHEQVDIHGSEIGKLKNNLLHYPYPSFSFYIEKWDRYNSSEAEILKTQGVKPSMGNFFKYMLVLPKLWFLKTYFRHKGFQDGFPGFVFSLFSAIRYWGIYVKLHERE
jgi:glycosyltransferase involved in cell wall biosynthesis